MSIGLVLYTDGGAKQNTAGRTIRMGFGIHGYKFTTEKSKQGNGSGNHVLTQTGYVYKNEHDNDKQPEVNALNYFDIHGSSQLEGNSYLAEALALTKAIELALTHDDVEIVNVYTDSDIVTRLINDKTLKIVDGVPINSKGKPISNPQVILTLLEKVELINKTKTLTVRWVKGHSDFLGNQMSDILASLGTEYALNGREDTNIEVSEPKGYWKYEVEKSDLLNLKRLYFRTDSDTRNVYYMSNPKEDGLMGRRVANSSYSVVILKEEDPAINILRDKFDEVIDIPSLIATVRLDKLYSKQTHKFITKYKGAAIRAKLAKSRAFNLVYLDSEELAEEIYPQALSVRVIDNFNYLHNLLDAYMQNGKIDGITFDVTGEFYQSVEVKSKETKVYRKDLGLADRVSFKRDIPVLDKTVSVEFFANLGLDLPDRNTLKRLETSVEKIALVVWYNSSNIINYGFILKTDKDIGIWSNFFSNKLFIK